MNSKQNQNNIPRWDLSTIYSSVNSRDYKKALGNLEKNFENLQKQLNLSQKEVDFSLWLEETLPIANNCDALFYSLFSYVTANYTTDTTNPVFLNAVSTLETAGLRVSELSQRFNTILAENNQYLKDFYTSFPQRKNYQYILEQKTKLQQHQMSDTEESIALDLQRYGADAWSRLQEQILSNAVDTETGKTFNTLRNEADHSERSVRKLAYEKELAILRSAEIPIAASLNNIKGATLSLNTRRKWETAIERSLFHCCISNKTLDALIGAMEESLPLWRDYFDVKAKLLGVEKCAFYDIFAPLTPKTPHNEESEKVWSFDEAREYITDKFYSFSTHMGDFAKLAFEGEWIDAEIRKGKVGGAYCTEFPAHKESRILTNFTGIFSDVTTLAHELGHAYHNWCVKDLEFPFAQYPMTLAETASIFAETIVLNDSLSKASGFERAQLLETHLSDGNQVIVDILSRFYFERSVFEERSSSELTAADFCRLMADAQEKTYGSGLNKERHEYMWAVKGHYYSAELDFYNFPYAFGLLFALSLYTRYEKEGTAFPPIYEALLRETGSFSCEQVCHNAGFDIETKEFWASGFKIFKDELAELKKYANG